ncbi:hypothetical protein [Pseudomarimonas salicorniae]|uniref:Uncharacterized protein n=1 Tax=Pseudomarimonas salicorniae TaxID=2933270 RepID=A0ABT0GHY2_9GAMM|nr:hypothetical protein [Lysobacter sp. CAU 1642]MCK7594153.1 hypothetical protein [Lysobacter sp. CAU 1642]
MIWRRVLAALALATLSQAPEAVEVDEAQYRALIRDPRVGEISGFAASHRHPGIIWTHNDSGDRAKLFALDPRGEVRATLHLRGARNLDWEDMALQRHPDGDLLLIADTGDNGGLRQELTIYAVREPATLQDGRPQVHWKMRFRWPDGARDCEALAVDQSTGELLLVSKKRVPPELFRLPAAPRGDQVEVAEALGTLRGIEQPTAADLERNPVYGRYRSQITSAAVSPDNRWLAVLNYRRVTLYPRSPGQSWTSAAAREPIVLAFPWLPQAEAVTFSADGLSLLIGSEKLPVPLIALPVPGMGVQNQTEAESTESQASH